MFHLTIFSCTVILWAEDWSPIRVQSSEKEKYFRLTVTRLRNVHLNLLSEMYVLKACDSAGPGFLLYDAEHDPKDAAKNVQCIHTSTDAGTWTYDCHQDWLMGT